MFAFRQSFEFLIIVGNVASPFPLQSILESPQVQNAFTPLTHWLQKSLKLSNVASAKETKNKNAKPIAKTVMFIRKTLLMCNFCDHNLILVKAQNVDGRTRNFE